MASALWHRMPRGGPSPLTLMSQRGFKSVTRHAREAYALMQVLHYGGDEDYIRLLGAAQNNYLLPRYAQATSILTLAVRAAKRYGSSYEDLKGIGERT